MFKNIASAFIVTTMLFCFLTDALASESSPLFSPSVAELLRRKASELYNDPNASVEDARCAMTFLAAADNLDRQTGIALPDMVRLAWKFPSVNSYDRIMPAFVKYAANDNSDLEVLRLSVQYLLEPLNSREYREEFFNRTIRMIGTRHKLFASDINTQLGLLAAERADMAAAEFYFVQAYNQNPYNKLAFQKILEISPQTLPVTTYLRHLRLMVSANPCDIDAAYVFANAAYNAGIYDTAASAYEYCADLFASMNPGRPLPSSLYIPLAMSCYNDPQRLKQCCAIAQSEGSGGRFDLYLEAICANAAVKLGSAEEGERMMLAAAKKAEQLFKQNQIQPQDLAWFYCFAMPNPQKALEWANKANVVEPNAPRTIAILAYALVMNEQHEVARPLIEQSYSGDQIASLAMGQIVLATDPNADPNSSFGLIKAAIALDAGSLEAQRGKELLSKKGSTYVPQYETAGILKALSAEAGGPIVGKFVPAEKLVAVKLTANGSEFPYGGNFNATLVITNKSSSPLTIFDGAFFSGNIRIDAAVKGDLRSFFPNLIVKKIRPSQAVEPGRSLFLPIELIDGQLASLLMAHPQAKAEIEFTAWLDPVIDKDGKVQNGIPGMPPIRLLVKRTAVDVGGTYLQTRLSSLSQGQPGQKIKTAQLFAGLLLEQQKTVGKKTYKMTYVEPKILRTALARCLLDENWNLQVETMLLLDGIGLDYNLTNAVSEGLSSNFWPVRMTALWLFGKDADIAFKKVLDWTAENDGDAMVVDMAVSLGAPAPKRTQETSENAFVPSTGKNALPEPNISPDLVVPAKKPAAEEPNLNKPLVVQEPNKVEMPNNVEPNQPPKPSEPNDLIEDILKS